MSDPSFLPFLFNEDVYVIKEENSKVIDELSVEPYPETQEPVPQPVIEEINQVTMQEESASETSGVEEPNEVYITPLATKGSNLKHCIIFVESGDDILEEASIAFLENILKAVKRSLEDVLLVNIKEAAAEQIEALLAEQNHRHLLCFGSNKLDSLIPLEHYQVHTDNHKFYLKGDALDLISTEKDKKKALWTALQEMFL